LLRLDGKRMSSLRLLKLLYIADRESLAEAGESITGDRAYAMEYGPVLTRVYGFIKGSGADAGRWDDFIHTDGYVVELVADPGRAELSRAIVDKLTDISERYRKHDEFALSDLTHGFPEWSNHYDGNGGSSLIPWQEMLSAQNKAEMVEVVERDEKARQVFDDVFGPEP
jgi:uncharacterized phage-associated protein